MSGFVRTYNVAEMAAKLLAEYCQSSDAWDYCELKSEGEGVVLLKEDIMLNVSRARPWLTRCAPALAYIVGAGRTAVDVTSLR
jgi:hypothetical protein